MAPVVRQRPDARLPEPPPTHPAAMSERDAGRYIARSVSFLRASRAGRGTPGPKFLRHARSILYLISDLDDWLLAGRVAPFSLRGLCADLDPAPVTKKGPEAGSRRT
jgi:hypothetical protein